MTHPNHEKYDIDFSINVGDAEKHRVDYLRQRHTSIHNKRRFEVAVGEREKHLVAIEKVKEPIYGGLKPQTCHVYVDGKLIGKYQPLSR